MSAFLILTFLLHLLYIPSKSSPSCFLESQCGGVTIKYPFTYYPPQFQSQIRSQNITEDSEYSSYYCGYPGLLISCENDTPIFHLNSDNYTVFSIDYNGTTISVADTNILNSASSCPRVNHNVTLNLRYIWIDFTNSDTNLLFFFNCSNSFPSPYIQSNCLRGNSYVILESDVKPNDIYYFSHMCQEYVVAPILNSAVNSYNLSNGFDEPMKKGFQLQWDEGTANCKECEATGGRCGYNLTNDSNFLEVCFCQQAKCIVSGAKEPRFKKPRFKWIIIGATIGFCCLIAFCAISFFFFRQKVSERNTTLKNIEATIRTFITFAPKRYSYYEIRKITGSFSEKLGQGGYGTVFKGKLNNGTLVAVKVFKDHESNGQDFINEVASIARTSHVNIVRLLGFSIKGSNRALVYEFMPNGSLDKYLRESQNSTTSHANCERLFEIIVGIARGLEYLHRGCHTRIVHFDIKPHNILLDHDYCPKISDFGLAKFCRPKESIISMSGMRGTIGYIAPEVFSRNFGTISSKSDVYSYGMMIFEMLGEKQNKPSAIECSSETYFPDNIYNYLEENTISSVYGLSNVNEELGRKMAIVGLWCIQLFPDSRPTMSRVLEMLEENIEDLSIPQKLSIPFPPQLVADSSSTA